MGKSCNRAGAECQGSHDARFWGKHGLSRELVSKAFNKADNVPVDGHVQDEQRRESSFSRGPSFHREGHTDYPRRHHDQSRRERSRSSVRQDDDRVTRDQVAQATHFCISSKTLEAGLLDGIEQNL